MQDAVALILIFSSISVLIFGMIFLSKWAQKEKPMHDTIGDDKTYGLSRVSDDFNQGADNG